MTIRSKILIWVTNSRGLAYCAVPSIYVKRSPQLFTSLFWYIYTNISRGYLEILCYVFWEFLWLDSGSSSCQSFHLLWIVVSDLYGLRYTTLDKCLPACPTFTFKHFCFQHLFFSSILISACSFPPWANKSLLNTGKHIWQFRNPAYSNSPTSPRTIEFRTVTSSTSTCGSTCSPEATSSRRCCCY